VRVAGRLTDVRQTTSTTHHNDAHPPFRVRAGERLRELAARVLLPLALSGSLSGCSSLPFFGDDEPAEEKVAQVPKISARVTGVNKIQANSVRAHLVVNGKPCTIARAYFESIASQVEAQAAEAMQAFGYYAASVTAETEYGGDCPRVAVTIAPGRQVTYGNVSVTIKGDAKDDPNFAKAKANLAIAPGEPLHHGQYKSAKGTFDSLANAYGYLEAKFTKARLAVAPEAGTADVEWVFDSGVRYDLGALAVEQQPALFDQDLIDRIIEYDPQAPYSVDEVSRINQALTRSGYFATVDVRPRFGSAEGTSIPVDVTVTPRNRHSFTSGVGASTDEGIRARAQYQNRRLNRRGHRLNAGTRVSLIEQSFSTEYQIPREHPQDEWLTFQAGVRRESVDTFDNTELQVSVSETKRRPWDWLETRYVELDRSIYEVAGESRNATFLVPGLRWVKSAADDPLFPRRGYRFNVEVRGAAETLISDTSFVRTTIGANGIMPMPFGARLLMRTDLGATWVDEFSALPPDERFFTGGDQTVRGYQYESLGPRGENGRVVGGTLLGVASLEYEQPVWGPFALAGFVDAGNAFGGDGENQGIKKSVGIGIRWRSPVGPMRLDFAHPLDIDDLIVFHLRLGPDL